MAPAAGRAARSMQRAKVDASTRTLAGSSIEE
jgi:hypothetical protein